jgi:hypothetical protein
MMRHRLSCTWILSLLLVFAQCGAVLHELGHLKPGHANGAAVVDLQTTDDGVCPTCEAFAQIANPASGTALDLAACPAEFIPAPDPCYSIVRASAPTPRSRGPPQV